LIDHHQTRIYRITRRAEMPMLFSSHMHDLHMSACSWTSP
jgi:hypothetical protein